MRSLQAKLRQGIRLFLIGLFASDLLGLGQVQEPPQLPPPPGQTNGRPPFGQTPQEENQDPALRHAMQEATKRRNVDRQNKMVADSDKICALAQELTDAIDKGGDDASSLAAAKKIDEIQKLAKGVKDRMRSE